MSTQINSFTHTLLAASLLISLATPARAETPQSLPVRNPFLPSTAQSHTLQPVALNRAVLASRSGRHFVHYKLSYIPAAVAKETLQPLCSMGKLSTDVLSNNLFYYGSIEEAQQLAKALAAIDLPSKQITLEAKVISLSNESSKNLGVSWAWEPIPQYESESSASSATSGNFKFFRSNSLRFGATLNALIAKGKAKILASPHIITLPGKQGQIFIGDHIPYQIEKHDSSGNYSATEYIDAGISLRYTPILDEQGRIITASVQTEVSTPTLVAELKNYKVTSRRLDTSVRMYSGETLVIGGLITEEEQRTLQKLPFLGDLPLLGQLFKNRSRSKNKTEILLLLTPYISPAGKSPSIYQELAQRLETQDISKEKLN